MELALLQRTLQALIKGTCRVTEDSPSYIRTVAASGHLAMVRDVVQWWRAFQVSRFCVLTSSVLQRQARFDSVVAAYLRERCFSPFIDEFGVDFLDWIASDPDRLVQSVAQFELTLLELKRGAGEGRTVQWDRDPEQVLDALLSRADLPPPDATRCFLTIFDGGAAGTFSTEVRES